MKTLLYLSALSALGSLLPGTAAVAGPPTVDVTVNGSTVTLTQGVPTTVGGSGSGAPVPVDIGNVVVMNGTASVSGSFSVNGQSLPLTLRVLSSSQDGTLQYALDGGASIGLGALGQVTAQPYGGVVQAGAGLVRVPITAALTWNAASPAAAPEPASWAAFGVGLAGLAGLAARRRGRLSPSARVERDSAQN